MGPEKKTIRMIFVCVAIGLLAMWGLVRPEGIADVLRGIVAIARPFVLGLSAAFIVNLLLRPVERGWERLLGNKGLRWLDSLKRPISILLSVAIIGASFFVLLFIVVPEVVGTIVLVADGMPEYAAKVELWWMQLSDNLAAYGVVLPQLDVNASDLGLTVTKWLTEEGPAFLGKTLGFTTSILTGAFNVVVGLVFALYVLADKERLGGQLRKMLFAFLPEGKADDIVEVADLAATTFAKYVTGQLTDAFIVGVLCYVGMLVLRLPHAAAVSVLVGATTIIPVIGVLLGTAIGAFLILVVDPVKALWFVVFIVLLQQIESNVIYPRVVGKSVGLPGIWVLAAVTIGGITYGVFGMLLAVPICSVLYTLLRRTIHRRLAAKQSAQLPVSEPD